MTAEKMHVAGLVDEALDSLRRDTNQSLAALEPELKRRHALLTRDLRNGDRFSAQLNEYHRVAADVAILRDRLAVFDTVGEIIDRRLRRAGRR